jgi:hypothetical protein
MMNNPAGAVALAKMIIKQNPQPVDTNVMADLFLQAGLVSQRDTAGAALLCLMRRTRDLQLKQSGQAASAIQQNSDYTTYSHVTALPVPQRNMVREATQFLLEALSGDRADQGPLQTKLLEINLITNPQARRTEPVPQKAQGHRPCTTCLPCGSAMGWPCRARRMPPSLVYPFTPCFLTSFRISRIPCRSFRSISSMC